MNTGEPAAMSSREIATLTGKQHKNVLRDIRDMVTAVYGAEIDGSDLSHEQIQGVAWERDDRGYLAVVHLDKSNTLTLLTGYDAKARKRVIDRWQQLEEQVRAPAFDPAKFLESPAAMRGLLLTYTEKVIALQGEVEEMRPAVQALDLIAGTDGSMSITEAAKNLQVQPKQLFGWMRSNEWIYRRPGAAADLAYQARLLTGYLEHKMTTVTRSDGSEKSVTQVRVTPKGLARLAKEFSQERALA